VIALILAALALQGSTPRVDSLMAAGRQHFAGKVVGRYAALDAFRAAARLAPNDPAPLYWQMKVGFYLGSDEGEVIAREAILRILPIDPDYEDVWDRFQTLYHNANIWRRADRALAAAPPSASVTERRAEIAIALEQPERAESLLALREEDPSLRSLLLRAEAAFLAARDTDGYRWYEAALAGAETDTAGALWDQLWMIATPEEVAVQDRTPAGEQREFLQRFWGKRDPNLVTPVNERIAEHFRRFAHARRYFRLLHPLSLYGRSPRWRAIIQQTQRDFLQARGMNLADPYPGMETDRLYAAMRQLPEVAPGGGTSSAAAGLDARGLIYIRHGAPDQMLRGFFDPLNPMGPAENALDVEGWLYRTSQGFLSIGFRRGTGSTDPAMAGGDFIFVPTNRRQAHSTAVALRTDRTTVAAPVAVRGWTAFFKSATPGLTDVFLKAAGDSAAAAVWGVGNGAVRAASAGGGALQLSLPSGQFDLGLDVDSAGLLGRARREIVVPRFTDTDLALSSLALAAGSTLLDRDDMLRAMPADLGYPAGSPLVTFVEIYGLTADPSGRSHYRLRYSFAPVRSLGARLLGAGPRPVVFEFDREILGTRVAERLVIEPEKLPAGKYRVTVVVTDGARNVKSESVALDIVIR
jgi:hypothetical protein